MSETSYASVSRSPASAGSACLKVERQGPRSSGELDGTLAQKPLRPESQGAVFPLGPYSMPWYASGAWNEESCEF